MGVQSFFNISYKYPEGIFSCSLSFHAPASSWAAPSTLFTEFPFTQTTYVFYIFFKIWSKSVMEATSLDISIDLDISPFFKISFNFQLQRTPRLIIPPRSILSFPTSPYKFHPLLQQSNSVIPLCCHRSCYWVPFPTSQFTKIFSETNDSSLLDKNPCVINSSAFLHFIKNYSLPMNNAGVRNAHHLHSRKPTYDL